MTTQQLSKANLYGAAVALCLTVASLVPVVASAQSLWLDQSRAPGVSIEALKPSFDNGDDITFFSAAYFASARVPLTQRLNLTAELPISHFGIDSDVLDNSDTEVGNPYLGLEIGTRESNLFGEVGVRVPLDGNDNTLLSGFASDLDRWEAFFGDVLSFTGQGNYWYRIPESSFSVRLRGGSNLWVYTNDDRADDVDLFANYGAQLWYHAPRVRVGAGATGRALLTEDGSFEERTTHQLGLSAIGEFQRVQPGVHFRLPVDDTYDDVVDYVVGLSLTVPIQTMRPLR